MAKAIKPVEIQRRKIKKRLSDDEIFVRKDSQTWPLIVASLFGGREIPPPDNYEAYASLYSEVVWVFACIRAIADAGASLPMDIFTKKIEGDEVRWVPVKTTHPSRILFANPNPSMTFYDLIEATMGYMEVDGNAFWELSRNKVGVVSEIYLMRPDRVTIIPAANGKGVKGYVFQVNKRSRKIHLDAEDVIHFKYWSPSEDWRGHAPILAATNTILTEQHAIRYNKAFFANNATPNGFLTTESSVGEEEAKRILREWDRKYQGSDKSHKTAMLTSGLKYQQMGSDPKDMEFIEQRRLNREEILSVFGVPPVKVGLLEHAKYDNYKLQEFAFYRSTIRPKMRNLTSTINRFLNNEMAKGEEELRVRFDFEEFLGEDLNQKVQRFFRMFGMGAVSPNDIIEMFELGDPYDGGEEHFINSGFTPVTGDGAHSIQRRETALAVALKRLQDIVDDTLPDGDTEENRANGFLVEDTDDTSEDS